MSALGDCFLALPPNSADGTTIIGRNAEDGDSLGVAQEVFFYEADEALAGNADGGASPEITGENLRLILQKPKPGVWGSDYGANERNVVATVSWSSGEEFDCGGLLATDIVRYVLATSTTAVDAVERCGDLVAMHGAEGCKYNLVICDPSSAWIVSCVNKFWAACQIKDAQTFIPSTGLAVTTTIEKSNADLSDALKAAGVWNGEGDLNFAACFDAYKEASASWSGPTPAGDGCYVLTSMFETLRSASTAESSRSANVSVLTSNGISCHWFTATPNASESVFKPFVFAPNSKISPLTKVLSDGGDNTTTLLHKLHGQRKPGAVDDLKALEIGCVEEVNAYLAGHPEADDELDELMKDCVEAEVKFYR